MSKQAGINYSQVDSGLSGSPSRSGEVIHYPSRRGIHWRAPSLIISSLIAGVAFSLGHHLFYSHLNGKEVDATISQTWAIRIGTGFAFVVKMFFGLAVATSFVQRQWWKLNRGSHRVAEIDSLTTVLENAWTLVVDIWLWVRNPVLLTMALIHWFLPIIAVVTPGTINVDSSKPHLTNQTLKAPQPYYGNSTPYANVAYQGTFSYQEPQPEVLKVSTASAATGNILFLNFPVDNSTYEMEFLAPTVQCPPVNQSIYDVVFDNVNTTYIGGEFGWVKVVGFVNGDDKGTFTKGDFLDTTNYSDTFTSLDTLSLDVARLFVISAPTLHVNETATLNMFECQLHNATYQVKFNLKAGQQDIQILKIDLLNPVAATGPTSATLTLDEVEKTLSYQSVMDAFGKLVVGAITYERHGWLSSCTGAFCSQARLTNIDWGSDANTVQTGLETLFHNITLGLLSSPDFLANDTLASDTGVVVTNYPLTYSYDPRDLWLAYGIGAALSLICIVVGLHALILNDAGYRNIFSTFIRSTRNVQWSGIILPSDTGADPVPKALKAEKIKVTEAVEHSYPLQPMPYQSTYPDSMNPSQSHLGHQ